MIVGSLDWWSTDQQLEDLFSQFGKIEQLRIFSDKINGKSKGFASIEFPTASIARDAVKLDGYPINQKSCSVEYATAQRIRQLRFFHREDWRAPTSRRK